MSPLSSKAITICTFPPEVRGCESKRLVDVAGSVIQSTVSFTTTSPAVVTVAVPPDAAVVPIGAAPTMDVRPVGARAAIACPAQGAEERAAPDRPDSVRTNP